MTRRRPISIVSATARNGGGPDVESQDCPFRSRPEASLGRGDVGAGGAKLDWSASGDLAYRMGKGWLLGAGYRTLNVERDKAGAVVSERRLVDLSMRGPRLWILYTW